MGLAMDMHFLGVHFIPKMQKLSSVLFRCTMFLVQINFKIDTTLMDVCEDGIKNLPTSSSIRVSFDGKLSVSYFVLEW